MLHDLTGQRFNLLTAVRRVENRGRRTFWLFRCDCGGEAEVWAASVKRGTCKSCGCLYAASRERGRLVHGGARKNKVTPEFRSWAGAKARCTQPTNAAFASYGGRGITMHPGWLNSFATFFDDMGPRAAGTSLDRIDNDRGYEPGNCRWATREQQVRNRRSTRYIEHGGRRMSLGEFTSMMAVRYKAVWQRMRNTGETAQEAVAHFMKA